MTVDFQKKEFKARFKALVKADFHLSAIKFVVRVRGKKIVLPLALAEIF